MVDARSHMNPIDNETNCNSEISLRTKFIARDFNYQSPVITTSEYSDQHSNVQIQQPGIKGASRTLVSSNGQTTMRSHFFPSSSRALSSQTSDDVATPVDLARAQTEATMATSGGRLAHSSMRARAKPSSTYAQGASGTRPSVTSPHEPQCIDQYLSMFVTCYHTCVRHLLVHPFSIWQLQCQCHCRAAHSHVTPFSLVPIVYRQLRRHGPCHVLGKGCMCLLFVHALSRLCDDLLTKWLASRQSTALSPDIQSSALIVGARPAVTTPDNCLLLALRRLAVSAVTCIVTLPFYSAALAEMVQSSVVTESSTLLDLLGVGLSRAVSCSPGYHDWHSSAPVSVMSRLTAGSRALTAATMFSSTRVLPLWRVFGVCVLYAWITDLLFEVSLSRLVFCLSGHPDLSAVVSTVNCLQFVSSSNASSYDHQDHTDNDPMSSELFRLRVIDGTRYAGRLLAYPLYTVCTRLLLQGCRVLIDNFDTGTSVLPINFRYEGVIDCVSCIRADEGVVGFYKGFGALIGEIIAHTGAMWLCAMVLVRVRRFVNSDRFGKNGNRVFCSTSSHSSDDLVFTANDGGLSTNQDRVLEYYSRGDSTYPFDKWSRPN